MRRGLSAQIYSPPVNDLGENVGRKIHQNMREIGHDYQ